MIRKTKPSLALRILLLFLCLALLIPQAARPSDPQKPKAQ